MKCIYLLLRKKLKTLVGMLIKVQVNLKLKNKNKTLIYNILFYCLQILK